MSSATSSTADFSLQLVKLVAVAVSRPAASRNVHTFFIIFDFGLLFNLNYGRRPVANLYNIPMMANTNKMWIREPTASPNPKYPTNHPTIRITTISQMISLIMLGLIITLLKIRVIVLQIIYLTRN